MILLLFPGIISPCCCQKKKPEPEVKVINPVHKVLERSEGLTLQEWEVIRRELKRNGIELVKQ